MAFIGPIPDEEEPSPPNSTRNGDEMDVNSIERYEWKLRPFIETFKDNLALLYLTVAEPSFSNTVTIPKLFRYPKISKGTGGYADQFRSLGMYIKKDYIARRLYHSWQIDITECNFKLLQKAVRKKCKEMGIDFRLFRMDMETPPRQRHSKTTSKSPSKYASKSGNKRKHSSSKMVKRFRLPKNTNRKRMRDDHQPHQHQHTKSRKRFDQSESPNVSSSSDRDTPKRDRKSDSQTSDASLRTKRPRIEHICSIAWCQQEFKSSRDLKKHYQQHTAAVESSEYSDDLIELRSNEDTSDSDDSPLDGSPKQKEEKKSAEETSEEKTKKDEAAAVRGWCMHGFHWVSVLKCRSRPWVTLATLHSCPRSSTGPYPFTKRAYARIGKHARQCKLGEDHICVISETEKSETLGDDLSLLQSSFESSAAQRFDCHQCTRVFQSKQQRYVHTRASHFRCVLPFCLKSFETGSREEFDEHIRGHIGATENWSSVGECQECEVCHQNFTSFAQLEIHYRESECSKIVGGKSLDIISKLRIEERDVYECDEQIRELHHQIVEIQNKKLAHIQRLSEYRKQLKQKVKLIKDESNGDQLQSQSHSQSQSQEKENI